MNPPQRINDRSVLKHEPLRTHIALFQQCESRSQRNEVISHFVKAMKKDRRATLASKEWAYYAFADYDLPRDRFEVTDDEEMLYEAFFLYHVKLSGGDCQDLANFRSHVVRNGIGTVKPDESNARGRKAGSQKASGPKKVRQAKADDHHSHQGNAETSSSRSATDSSSATTSGAGTRLSRLSAGAKLKRLASKKEKKRKAISQKPPVITPSDASEDEKRPETREVGSSISHRSKRIAPNPPPHKPRVASAPQLKTEHQDSISRPAALTVATSDNLFSGFQVAKRSAGRPLSRHRGSSTKLSKAFKRRARSELTRPRKTKSVGDLPTRPSKRLRGASAPTMDGEREGVFASVSARFIPEPVIKTPDPPSNPEKVRVKKKAKASKKRTRPENELTSAATIENAQIDYSEFLGPDVRPLRPLPRKVCNERAVPLSDEETSTRRIPGGGLSLQDVDQVLRDSASNALAFLREGGTPDVPDWTQEQDAECDVPDDQDEANDVQSTATTSVASVGVKKPPVPAPPRIWAQSRQEVCESLEHFRSYHSGVYSKDDVVKGYLLGAYAASRDLFHHGGKLIISHGGGKSEAILDTRKGAKRYQTDQDQESSDKSVRALLKTCQDRRPLVLLADDKYALFPYDLTSGKFTYVVLGLYWISHAWAECQPSRDGSGRIVRWKFAFQWCEGQGDPWWTPQQDISLTPGASALISGQRLNGSLCLSNTSENPNIECESCQEQSPFVYQQGWMCLNPHCQKFWTMNDEEPKQLDYREQFLSLLPRKFEILPNIIPAKLVVTPGGVTTTFACSKGWHCAKCGRLSCRFKWEHWECSNCGFKHEVKGRVRSPKEFWNQRPPKEFLHSRVGKGSGIQTSRLEPINLGKNGYTSRLTFILPHGRGKIHLILGTPLSNENADCIFQLYQQQASNGDLKLRRYPLRNHRARGLLLTNYFSQNSGEPYQYVGGTGNTVPFNQAPECVRRALAEIKERARLALHADIPFNEILSAAYMERQKMSFHSDSEKGLGPVVASLSLGSAALMHFRPLVQGGEPKGKSPNALTLVLRHGDVLIMDGDGVQKYYEHTVVPMNFRIAATARCIGST